jgi:hypothetical protein
MNVADILFDAIEYIKGYQKDDWYTGQDAFFVEQVKLVMLAVKIYFDWLPLEALENITEGIGWCVYCGNADINDPMQPSEVYKAEKGIDALVCSRCYPLEVILQDLQRKYKATQDRTGGG